MSAIPNTKVSLNELVLKSLYYRYRDFVVPLSAIGVCILLIFFVVIPQVQAWFAMKDQIEGDSQKLEVLKQNLQTITNIDGGKLDTDLDISSRALPTDKDFAGVLQAISNSAAAAGSVIGDYSFQIGDLASNTQGKQSQLPLQLTINIKGTLVTGKSFIENLKSQLPLADVTSISVNSNGTINLNLVFYYASLPKITFDDSVPLVIIPQKDEDMLQTLQKNATVAQPDNLPLNASQSAFFSL